MGVNPKAPTAPQPAQNPPESTEPQMDPAEVEKMMNVQKSVNTAIHNELKMAIVRKDAAPPPGIDSRFVTHLYVARVISPPPGVRSQTSFKVSAPPAKRNLCSG